jgi:hypothetical protein
MFSTPPLTKRVVTLRDFLTFSETRSIMMGKADNMYDAISTSLRTLD